MNEKHEIVVQDVNEITKKIIGCAFEVSNTLEIGFVEKVYENALVHLLREAGLKVAQQFPIKVSFDGIIVGDFVADLLVEDRVLVELKAVSFGKSKVEIKRLLPSINWKTTKP